MTDDDLPFMHALFATTKSFELQNTPLTDEQKAAFVEMQFDAQHTHYMRAYESDEFLVILCKGEPAGRLYIGKWKKTIRIIDLSLMPDHRSRGIGTRIFQEVFAAGDEIGLPVSIHVEIYNPARRLYDRLGFRQVEDKGVYLLLERPVGGGTNAEEQG